MKYLEVLKLIAHELGLSLSEESITIMLGLLDTGVSADNLRKILENTKMEIKSQKEAKTDCKLR